MNKLVLPCIVMMLCALRCTDTTPTNNVPGENHTVNDSSAIIELTMKNIDEKIDSSWVLLTTMNNEEHTLP